MGNYISYIDNIKKILYQIDLSEDDDDNLNTVYDTDKLKIVDEKISSNNKILKNKFKTIFVNSKEHNNNLKKEFIKQKSYCIISYIEDTGSEKGKV